MSVMSAQAIITIAPVDIGANPGLSGGIKGSFLTNRGNTQSDEYSAGSRVQYDNNTAYVIWGDIAFSYATASGQTNTNNTFAHVRYIHTLYKKDVNWEAFVQSQTNEFTDVQRRSLAGAGLRLHKLMRSYGSIYFGFGAFGEHIKYTTNSDPIENNVRLNIYIAYKNKFTKSVKVSYIGYCQPKIDDFSDVIVFNAAELRVRIYKQFSINFKITYNLDTKPATGVEKYDFTQNTSFIYEF